MAPLFCQAQNPGAGFPVHVLGLFIILLGTEVEALLVRFAVIAEWLEPGNEKDSRTGLCTKIACLDRR